MSICSGSIDQSIVEPNCVIPIVKIPPFAIQCSNPGKTNVITKIIITINLAVSSLILTPEYAATQTMKLHKIPLINKSMTSKLT